MSTSRIGTSLLLLTVVGIGVALVSWSQRVAQARATSDEIDLAEVRAIAKEAYVYGFPLVDNYRVLYSYFVDRKSKEFKAPWNEIHNEARVYTPEDRAIQTPNSDTPYSQLGTDLRAEPLVLTVPDVDDDRYYALQFIDLYTFNYAYVGTRTTGSRAKSFLLAGPRWTGDKPDGIEAVIRSETELGWVLYRTQLFNPADIENVKRVQAGYRVQPLSTYLGTPAPDPAPEIDFIEPLSAEEQRTSPEFFEVLSFVLQFCPTHPSEKELAARFAKLGIGAHGDFDAAKLSSATREAVELGMKDAWDEFERFKREEIDTGKRDAAEAFGTRAYLKNDYLVRMSAAVLGIYGNSKEEALYPAYYVDSDGEKLDGRKHRYQLRFERDGVPPVNAFWSLTMYQLPESRLVANALDRYLINSSMLTSLARDGDGGITIYVQSASPGGDKESNWLPAPDGPFWMVLRLYWPKDEALRGTWKPPAVHRTE